MPRPRSLHKGVSFKATKIMPGQGKVAKLTALKPGAQFKFANVGGDVDSYTIIAQPPKHVTVFKKGGTKLVNMPLPLFQNSRVILLKKG